MIIDSAILGTDTAAYILSRSPSTNPNPPNDPFAEIQNKNKNSATYLFYSVENRKKLHTQQTCLLTIDEIILIKLQPLH